MRNILKHGLCGKRCQTWIITRETCQKTCHIGFCGFNILPDNTQSRPKHHCHQAVLSCFCICDVSYAVCVRQLQKQRSFSLECRMSYSLFRKQKSSRFMFLSHSILLLKKLVVPILFEDRVCFLLTNTDIHTSSCFFQSLYLAPRIGNYK